MRRASTNQRLGRAGPRGRAAHQTHSVAGTRRARAIMRPYDRSSLLYATLCTYYFPKGNKERVWVRGPKMVAHAAHAAQRVPVSPGRAEGHGRGTPDTPAPSALPTRCVPGRQTSMAAASRGSVCTPARAVCARRPQLPNLLKGADMAAYPNPSRHGASARTLRRAPTAPGKLPQNTLEHVRIIPPSLIEHRPELTFIAKQTGEDEHAKEFDVELSAPLDALQIVREGDRVRIKMRLRHASKDEEARLTLAPRDLTRDSNTARQYLADIAAFEKKVARALAQWREDAETFGYDSEMS